MKDIEKLKKEIENLEIQDLAHIIRTEPLIAGRNSILIFNKKQREELKTCMLEIAKKCLDLSVLEEKFLLENMNKMKKEIFITNEKEASELKELLKKHLDRKTYKFLKDLF